MSLIRRLILAFALMAGIAPAVAQAPPPVPGLPDAERRTSFSLTAQTGPFSVGFALYGDSTDYGDWLQVWLCTSAPLNPCSQLTAVTDWTLSSATGSLATIPRPITDATITLNAARTGTLQIVGARRPRRTAQFTENRGVAARDLNQIVTDLVAQNRENWDVQQRQLRGQPGELISALQPATTRAGGILCWDATGLIPQTCAAGSSGTANVVGPNVSVVGHIATFGNTLGTVLTDGGLIGAGNLVGPIPSVSVANHAATWKDAGGINVKDSGLTLTPSTGTFTLVNAKTLTVDNSLEFAGTDATVMTFPTTSATLARTDAANTFTGHQTIEGVTSTGATGTGKLVFDTAPTLGVTTVTSINKVTVTAPATGSTLTIADGKTLTDTSGIGASVLLGATGGGFAAYGGTSCTNQFVRSLSAAAAATCATVANTDLTSSSVTIGSTSVALGGTAATIAGLTLTAPIINGGMATGLTGLGIRSTGSGAFDAVLANTENLTAQRTLTLTLNNANRLLSLSGDLTTAAAFTTSGANPITLNTTGNTNVTLPTTGTLAVQNASNAFSATNTFSAANTFSALTQFTDAKFSSGKLYPTADSTTAMQVCKADGVTCFATFDTTNQAANFSTLKFTTLDAASLQNSPSTITGMTINNSPNASNDYIPYYNAAAGQWRRSTVSGVASGAVAGVSTLNGLSGGLSVVGGTGITVSAGGSSVTVNATSFPLRGYLAGLILSTAGSSATFGISAGQATDSTSADNMALASAYTKTTSAWAVGSANGALDTGAIANSTWYHVYLIKRTDTGVVDVLFSLSASAPTMPTNYTLFRRIGSMLTDGAAQWTKFIQLGDEFLWSTAVVSVSGVTLGVTTAVLETLTTPLGIQVGAVLNYYGKDNSVGATQFWITSPDEVDSAASGSLLDLITPAAVSSNAVSAGLKRTNTSSQIRVRCSTTTGQISIITRGWIDTRGRLL